MSKFVTFRQAVALNELGFRDACCNVIDVRTKLRRMAFHCNYNSKKYPNIISLPTVDEAIDWIRRKFNVMIIDSAEPFVDICSNEILYSYRVKYCNIQLGWNGRMYIGTGIWSKDSYAAKRDAIRIAISYIKSKGNNVRTRRRSRIRRRKV